MLKKLLTNSGPWGSWNGDDKKDNNQEKNKQPKNNNGQNNNNGDFTDLLKKGEEFISKIINEAKDGNGGGKNPFNKNSSGSKKTPKSLIGIIVLALILIWLSSGFYKVEPEENAVVLYFGKFHAITTPGLNYHIPYPFGKVIKKSVITVNTEEFGFTSTNQVRSRYSRNINRNLDAESLMLTGDENIVDIEFQVQWQISDIKDYVFNIAEPNLTIRKSAESAMREIIARTPIADALSDGKKRIEDGVKDTLQEILDSYGAGVRVVLVQLRRVDPPAQVIDAFRDVQTAKADKEKEINQAEAYANDIIPRARGAAAKMKEEAQAYKQEVVAKATGEAGRFLSVYYQYRRAKAVTMKRIYLETMEKVYRDMDKVIIDKGAANGGLVPYFPLSDMQKNSKK